MRFLYDAVGLSMWAYSNAVFRVVVLGPRRFRLEPRTIIVVTHRRETDVPVISPILYFGARLWRYVDDRMAFAARDDMFARGFFAGFPEGLSPRARRLLFRIDIGSKLPLVHVHPIGSARLALVQDALAALPTAPLEEVLPADLAGDFRNRAARLGLPAPARAQEALRGEYADLLFGRITREEVHASDLAALWSRRAGEAARDFRFLVELVRSGRSLLVFPEGRPSPDGEIGPLRRGVDALVRRARPCHLLPIALAYDPLVRGRTRVLVSLGELVPAPTDDVDRTVLELLRRTMPLTCGQYVASEVLAGGTPSPDPLAAAVDSARSEGRRIDPRLATADGRARALDAALTAAKRRRGDLPYLAREYESAHERRD